MAAQVLSGSGNVSYTNSTGQNVRLVINYLEIGGVGTDQATVTFAGVSVTIFGGGSKYGKTLAYDNNPGSSMAAGVGNPRRGGLPLEIAMANGDTFSITHDQSEYITGYNIIIVPEAG